MLSGHDFLMARAALDELAEGVRELTVCIDSAKTVLVPAALYSTDMNEGYMAVNDKPVDDDERVVTASCGDVIALMAVDSRIATLLANLDECKVSYTSPLLEGVVGYTRAVRITLTAENTYVVVSDNGKLLYAEVFATTEPENLLFVMSKLNDVLSLKGYEVRVQGDAAPMVVESLAELFADCKIL